MKIDTDPKKIDQLLHRGTEEVFVADHLKEALLSGKRLRVKLGFDPTGPNIHLGRAVILRKLRDFQRLGHKIVFIVGDFTALIGDPSDKLGKRPMLTEDKIKENLRQYKTQVGKIIDLSKAEFKFNSKWLKKLNFKEAGILAESFSVNQMLARRNFKDRWVKEEEISLRELLYPLMQGYDSVEVKADVEIGGFDQLFNLKAGRIIQRHYGEKEQDILTTQMLEGLDGRKMSTSWNNVVNITDEPTDMFGKIMSIHDDLIKKYFNLCTDKNEEEVKEILSIGPRDAKLKLAKEVVAIYHGEKLAEKAEKEFKNVFSDKKKPENMGVLKISVKEITLVDLVMESKFAKSKSEARRLIDQGGVYIDDERKSDPNERIILKKEVILQIGPRKFMRVVN